MSEVLTVYLKPTNYCNVGCDHCYLSEATRAEKNKLSLNKLEIVCKRIKELMHSERKKKLHIIWHGGEPLTISAKTYAEMFDVIDMHFPDHTESMQTSLIPLKDEHISIIRDRFNFEIGSSIDFSQRKIKGSSERYFDLWLNKVALAREANIDVYPGVVPTRNEIGREKEIISFFIDNNFDYVNFERYNIFGLKEVPSDWPTNYEHSMFLIELFNIVMSQVHNQEKTIYIKQIIAGINGVIHGMPGDRWGTTCQKDFLVIEPDTGVNTCPDRSSHEKHFVKLDQIKSIQELQQSPLRKSWIKTQGLHHFNNFCMKCDYRLWCKSGCPIASKFNDGECSGYKLFLNHIKKYREASNDNEGRLIQYARREANE
ncbi:MULTISPECIES: radical SAM/SPASM domain-containing protein [Cysteiniphilum]|uniref:Anaerobic sulfatase maturase n=1 Tax=Cysteiniphilum litorale TaxID=2056700 RepID=A0A8J3E8J5_9GAMM|nr:MULTISPECIES: radical SAM protein [Cysteiniphilum]GGF91972.1 anaerobic sulfatase maturase [Cysteiniphilum litorale]